MCSRRGVRRHCLPATARRPPPSSWGDAMPDGQAYKLPDAPEQEVPADVQAPRLLNAAAWLEVLAALETEFATILGKNASSS